jgi:hypothetical protein
MSLSDLALLFSILAIAGTTLTVVIRSALDWAMDVEERCE